MRILLTNNDIICFLAFVVTDKGKVHYLLKIVFE